MRSRSSVEARGRIVSLSAIWPRASSHPSERRGRSRRNSTARLFRPASRGTRVALARPRARVGLLRDLSWNAFVLAHDVVARPVLDDLLDVGRDMAGRNGE
jgi:hypothetical protein